MVSVLQSGYYHCTSYQQFSLVCFEFLPSGMLNFNSGPKLILEEIFPCFLKWECLSRSLKRNRKTLQTVQLCDKKRIFKIFFEDIFSNMTLLIWLIYINSSEIIFKKMSCHYFVQWVLTTSLHNYMKFWNFQLHWAISSSDSFAILSITKFSYFTFTTEISLK